MYLCFIKNKYDTTPKNIFYKDVSVLIISNIFLLYLQQQKDNKRKLYTFIR